MVVRRRGVIKEKSPDFRFPEVGISAKVKNKFVFYKVSSPPSPSSLLKLSNKTFGNGRYQCVTPFFGTDFMPLKHQKQNLNTSRKHLAALQDRLHVDHFSAFVCYINPNPYSH